MTTEKKEEKNQVEVTARAFVDALIDVAMENQSNKIEEAYNSILEEKRRREEELLKKYKFEVPVN